MGFSNIILRVLGLHEVLKAADYYQIRPIEVCGLPGLKSETWGTQSFMDSQMRATRITAISRQGSVPSHLRWISGPFG